MEQGGHPGNANGNSTSFNRALATLSRGMTLKQALSAARAAFPHLAEQVGGKGRERFGGNRMI
jgi:hypothetical protein